MIASFSDAFLVIGIVGGLGLFFLIYGLRLIMQMISVGFNKTQENVDRLAKLVPVKRGVRKPINQKQFTATEAYVCAGFALFIAAGIVMGCIGALISVFS